MPPVLSNLGAVGPDVSARALVGYGSLPNQDFLSFHVERGDKCQTLLPLAPVVA